jgi:hypothetical protein
MPGGATPDAQHDPPTAARVDYAESRDGGSVAGAGTNAEWVIAIERLAARLADRNGRAALTVDEARVG